MKKSVADLAIFGGPPAFDSAIHVGRPNQGDREMFLRLVNEALDRNWLTNDGPLVQQLESEIAELTGAKHCVAMCNGTVSLEIASRALGLCGEVIVPSFTFVASAHALQWQEITPVFCDIEAGSHNIDPARILQLITPRTTGILAVHLWGEPCAVQELDQIARETGLRLLFDAAHALGCSYGDRMIGNFGDAEVFSFHATKIVNGFEGGAVITNDDTLAGRMRLMRNFGFVDVDEVQHIGTNGKMSELSAAMAITGLRRLDELMEVNRSNYEMYRAGLSEIPGVSLHEVGGRGRSNYQYVVVEVDRLESRLTRDQLVNILRAENVLVRRYFYPGCHRMEPYRSYFPNAGLLLPVTERVCDAVMVLPTGSSVCSTEIARVCSLIHFSVENGVDIADRMQAK